MNSLVLSSSNIHHRKTKKHIIFRPVGSVAVNSQPASVFADLIFYLSMLLLCLFFHVYSTIWFRWSVALFCLSIKKRSAKSRAIRGHRLRFYRSQSPSGGLTCVNHHCYRPLYVGGLGVNTCSHISSVSPQTPPPPSSSACCQLGAPRRRDLDSSSRSELVRYCPSVLQ